MLLGPSGNYNFSLGKGYAKRDNSWATFFSICQTKQQTGHKQQCPWPPPPTDCINHLKVVAARTKSEGDPEECHLPRISKNQRNRIKRNCSKRALEEAVPSPALEVFHQKKTEFVSQLKFALRQQRSGCTLCLTPTHLCLPVLSPIYLYLPVLTPYSRLLTATHPCAPRSLSNSHFIGRMNQDAWVSPRVTKFTKSQRLSF